MAQAAVATSLVTMTNTLEQEYKVYLNNLTRFIDSLEKTSHVKFLYFVLDNSRLPKIRTTLGKWNGIGNQIHYIGHGFDKHYVYVYKETDLKVLIELAHTHVQPNNTQKHYKKFGIYNVKLVGPPGEYSENESNVASIGHHIDWSIHKSGKELYVKLHKTIYTYDDYNNTFVREAVHCNFNLHSGLKNDISKSEFEKINCANKIGPTNQTIMSTFHTDDDDVVVSHELLKKTLGIETLHEPSNNRIKIGGGGVSYHGLTFMNDQFIKFIHAFLIRPSKRYKPDIASVEVFYDEFAEISVYGPKCFMIMYTFENGNMDVFHIDMLMALKACHVEVSKRPKFTKDELGCHAYFKNIKENGLGSFRNKIIDE